MIFKLTDEMIFPHPSLAEEDGLLAVGGDLSEDRLLLAYENGIFPWYSDDTPILWYSPPQRFVLFPSEIKISKSMRNILNSAMYSVTMDNAFDQVINACSSSPRKDQDGTWITLEMTRAYIDLHHSGYAHSIEVWEDEELVGGLYGVLINKIFCGESMFSKKSNASKTALIWLCKNLDLDIIDCQIYSEHLQSMGAKLISRDSFLKILKT